MTTLLVGIKVCLPPLSGSHMYLKYCLMNSSEYLYHSDQRKTHCMRKKVLKTITIFPFKIEI